MQDFVAAANKVAYIDSGLGATQARGKVSSSAFGYTTPY
jgi:hypothetical protein